MSKNFKNKIDEICLRMCNDDVMENKKNEIIMKCEKAIENKDYFAIVELAFEGAFDYCYDALLEAERFLSNGCTTNIENYKECKIKHMDRKRLAKNFCIRTAYSIARRLYDNEELTAYKTIGYLGEWLSKDKDVIKGFDKDRIHATIKLDEIQEVQRERNSALKSKIRKFEKRRMESNMPPFFAFDSKGSVRILSNEIEFLSVLLEMDAQGKKGNAWQIIDETLSNKNRDYILGLQQNIIEIMGEKMKLTRADEIFLMDELEEYYNMFFINRLFFYVFKIYKMSKGTKESIANGLIFPALCNCMLLPDDISRKFMMDITLRYIGTCNRFSIGFIYDAPSSKAYMEYGPSAIPYLNISAYIEEVSVNILPEMSEIFVALLFKIICRHNEKTTNVLKNIYGFLSNYINEYGDIISPYIDFEIIKDMSEYKELFKDENCKRIFDKCVSEVKNYISKKEITRNSLYYKFKNDIRISSYGIDDYGFKEFDQF